MELLSTLFIFAIGFASAFIGGLTGGGGGFLSVPGLMFVGLPPHAAIATTKAGAFGSAVATIYKFGKEKKIRWHLVMPLTIMAIVGTYIGAQILLDFDPEALTNLIGVLLVALVPITFMGNHFGTRRKTPTTVMKWVGYVLMAVLAVYDGFFGLAGGMIGVYILVMFFGLTYIEANATTRIPWFASLFTVTVVFAFEGMIDYWYVAVLFISRLIGGYIGAHVAIVKGEAFVKAAFSLIVVAFGIKLLFF